MGEYKKPEDLMEINMAEEGSPNLKKVTILVSDPDPLATDSPSGEEDHEKQIRRRKTAVSVGFNPRMGIGNSGPVTGIPSFESDNISDPGPAPFQSPRRPIPGVRMLKLGKWVARIRNPFTRQPVWLGTFNSEKEASQAYLSKKLEFEKMAIAKQGIKNSQVLDPDPGRDSYIGTDTKSHVSDPDPDPRADLYTGRQSYVSDPDPGDSYTATKRDVLDSNSDSYTCADPDPDPDQIMRRPIPGVRKRKPGRWSAEIKNPINQRCVWLGNFNSEEAASQAYLSKKLVYDIIARAKQGIKKKKMYCSEVIHPISDRKVLLGKLEAAEDASQAYRSKKIEFEESQVVGDGDGDDAGMWLGQWVRMHDGREVNFSVKYGMPIIDNYGHLLGEFRRLDDDLWIDMPP